MTSYVVTTHAIISVICFGIFGLGCTFAVFSGRVRDTTFERIALAWVALASFGTAARVIKNGWISEGGLALSMGLAFYICTILVKKWRPEKDMGPP